MRFGYWTPTMNKWLRNVDEPFSIEFDDLARIARRAEELGFDITLIPELNLSDIGGKDQPVLDAWSLAAALAANTTTMEILAAARPSFHQPVQLAAKQAATIQHIAKGRFSLNVVSAWWAEEAKQYGVEFRAHDDRYAVTTEYVAALRELWATTPARFEGEYVHFAETWLEPKPSVVPRIYAGGESEAGRAAITDFADAYLTHGGTVEELAEKIADMRRRREEAGREPFAVFGMAAYPVVRDTEEEARAEVARITDVRPGTPGYDSYVDFTSKSQLNVQVSLEDYSVSNRGLRPQLVGTPQQVADRILEFEDAGVGVLLLQFSPAEDELVRFGEQVIPLVNKARAERGEKVATPA